MSVSLVARTLRDGHYVQRPTCSASVLLAATLQFLTATVLELAYREARYRSRRRITPELLEQAFLHNALFRTLLGTTTISHAVPDRP
ncbi:Histone H2A-Bbd type 2/3 [Fukomys damarensis]|uniref:Histone H2A-Bbd type 2/3 n=1 Tax=Fukomys damarensis TaxID=885580 RepID=A0A091DVR4_FUKDA|nr:Histone H2A-Bbd type 2/3 [Fukomys damarensis]